MEAPLYLDTARMGLMCPRAGEALYAAARLAAEEGLSPRFCEFLRHGFSTLPGALRERCGGLRDWNSVTELKRALARLIDLPGEPLALIASRSTALMQLAARVLFLRCRRVLTTDLEWPAYREILAREARRTGRELVTAPLGDPVFADGASAEEVAAAACDFYRLAGCDGLFVGAVSYHGVRLPAGAVCERVAGDRRTRFVAIDGSQATAHVPVTGLGCCDLFLTGCHKWLRAHLPVGVALCPRPRSAGLVREAAARLVGSFELDDPLLRFTGGLEAGSLVPYGETVGVTGLFTARAAAEEHLAGGRASGKFTTLLGNADRAIEASRGTGWRPLRVHPTLRSGMLLFDPPVGARMSGADDLRARFQEAGVVLTAYHDGRVRLSMPDNEWRAGELERLRSALRLAA